ncbi:serine carboxypeptidase-like 42 [Aristolochia californica]|uniref:serine carboxypeptidase-like 42 n=1 Tax=Aristolochia californica TaxID=171875 RepID=UPI0035D98242
MKISVQVRVFWPCCFWVLLPLLLLGVTGHPLEDLVVRLPRQPKVNYRQFDGYITVANEAGRSLFYYLAEAYGDAHTRSIWRCTYQKHMEMHIPGHDTLVEWRLRWYEKFPEFKSKDLFLTRDSYAGHYKPQLVVAWLNHNKYSTGFMFNIQGVAIGNPLLKCDRDIPATYEYFWSHGMISDEIAAQQNAMVTIYGDIWSGSEGGVVTIWPWESVDKSLFFGGRKAYGSFVCGKIIH